ncbi:MAG TPA: hypothetical protein VJT73_05210 [Polyangiaceae bacterium]|nr:hypothetical protein [Polyangiaceae bacterium]
MPGLRRPVLHPSAFREQLHRQPGQPAGGRPHLSAYLSRHANGATEPPEPGNGPSAPIPSRGESEHAHDDVLLPESSAAHPGDPLDPMTRTLLAPGLGPQGVARTAAPTATEQASLASRASLDHVLTRLVRRMAWAGDSHNGTARLELGAGELEGATLVIHAEGGALRVSLDVPPGVDGAAWKERLSRRLGARGLQVASFEVE